MDQSLDSNEIKKHLANLQLAWNVVNDNKQLEYEFRFPTYDEALEFLNKVAEIAKVENHHPDICIYYNKIKITTWTHSVNGLSVKDFKIAMLIENVFKPPF